MQEEDETVQVPTDRMGLGDIPADNQLSTGTQIGRFTVLGLIGSGGMGSVHKAYDPGLDRAVAIKLLHVSDDRGGAHISRNRLLREAQALAKVVHPNVVSVYEVGEFGQAVFVAMELVEGQSLREWLASGERSVSEILDVFGAAGRGLGAAHDVGLVHRDFKPDNVMVGNSGRVCVLDFGLAKTICATPDLESGEPNFAAEAQTHDSLTTEAPTQPLLIDTERISNRLLDRQLTMPGTHFGTPAYMAPEQFLGMATDALTDQFSFCVALYQALFGTRPFRGRNLQELKSNVTLGNIEPSGRNHNVPDWLSAIVTKGLSPAPKDRYPSMDMLLQALAADPRRSRPRRLRIAALALLLGLATTGGILSQWDSSGGLCAHAEAKLAGTWEAPQRRALGDAFLASGLPYARDSYERVTYELDRYAKQWVTMHTDACVATHVRGEQSERLLDLRMFCLSRRLKEFYALSEVLQKADAAVVEKAVQAAQNLTPVAQCGEVEALAAFSERVHDVANEQERQEVEKIRGGLAKAKALEQTGQYKPGLQLATELVHNAETLAYQPLMAEALFRQASLHAAAGHLEDSTSLFRAAAWQGIASQYKELVAHAAIRMQGVFGYWQGQTKEARQWGQLAALVTDSLGAPDALLAELENSLGELELGAGNTKLGLRHHRRALELRRRVYGEQHNKVAWSWNNVGASLVDLESYDEARQHFERALAIWTEVLGAKHPAVATSLTNLAESLSQLEQYDKAAKYSLRAISIWESSLGRGHHYLVFPLTTLGEMALKRDAHADARGHFQRALDLCAQTKCHPVMVAHCRFGMAKVLEVVDRDRALAREQARLARDGFADFKQKKTELLAVDAWLLEHPVK